jgi:hypothetical protein
MHLLIHLVLAQVFGTHLINDPFVDPFSFDARFWRLFIV